MEDGNYKNKINFKDFYVHTFSPHLTVTPYSSLYGCGATSLSLLVGELPHKCSFRKTWDDKFMINYLKKHHWKTAKLTKHNICNRETILGPIAKNHIILLSCLFRKKEASWLVLYNNWIFHNFEIVELTSYEFLNLPILTAYLIKPPEKEETKDVLTNALNKYAKMKWQYKK